MDTPTPTVLTPQGDAPAAGESVLVPGTLAYRFARLSKQLREIDTLPSVGDLFYAIKNDGDGTGWRYVVSQVTAEDIHAAADALVAAPVASTVRTDADGVRGADLSDVLIELGTETEMDRDAVVSAMKDHPQFAREILDFALQWHLTPEGETGPAVAWITEADMKKLAKSRKPLQLWLFNRDPSDISGTPYAALTVSPSPSERDHYPWKTVLTRDDFEPQTALEDMLVHRFLNNHPLGIGDLSSTLAALRVSPTHPSSERDQHQGETQNEAIAMLREAIAKIDAFDNEPGDRATVILERKDQSTFEMIGVDNKPLRLSDLRKIAALSPEPHPVADKREGGDR